MSRIDPRTNKVVKIIRLGFNPHGVAVAGRAVWVAVAQGLRFLPERSGLQLLVLDFVRPCLTRAIIGPSLGR